MRPLEDDGISGLVVAALVLFPLAIGLAVLAGQPLGSPPDGFVAGVVSALIVGALVACAFSAKGALIPGALLFLVWIGFLAGHYL